jgi:hypothetical protein
MYRSLGTNAAFRSASALEVCAERAGSAMACAFWSSDEYESALITERRAAGIYGPRRHRNRLFGAAAIAAALFVLYALV